MSLSSLISRSGPALAVLKPEGDSNWFTLFEFEDEPDLDLESHDHHYNQLTKFDFPHRVTIEGSSYARMETMLMMLSTSLVNILSSISIKDINSTLLADLGGCHDYTLGSESWRHVEASNGSFEYDLFAAFVNGNLHWIVSDSDGTRWISCLDLETECFTTFSVPPLQGTGVEYMESLSSCLKDCLCLCDDTSEDEIVLWLMKEYGDEKSWTREYVVSINPGFERDGYVPVFVYPIKVFEDGDILMVWDERLLFYYSNKTKTSQEIGMFEEGGDYVS
ncbi:hypothetical protein OROHE_008054 [Orobanche hederae]